MKNMIIEEALPREALSQIGLYSNGKFLLSDEDILALLSGRRTSLLELKDISFDAFKIDSIQAKLSLTDPKTGPGEIKLHPIYHEPILIEFLSKEESQALISGGDSVSKQVPSAQGGKKTIVFEYDEQTREFIGFDPAKVEIPYQINGIMLKHQDHLDFAFGNLITFSDGTKIRHKFTEPLGMISNRPAVIVSTIINGEQRHSFLLSGLSALERNENQQSPFTRNFDVAFIEMQNENGQLSESALQQSLEDFKLSLEKTHESGVSR